MWGLGQVGDCLNTYDLCSVKSSYYCLAFLKTFWGLHCLCDFQVSEVNVMLLGLYLCFTLVLSRSLYINYPTSLENMPLICPETINELSCRFASNRVDVVSARTQLLNFIDLSYKTLFIYRKGTT